jgi:hypothetical protein
MGKRMGRREKGIFICMGAEMQQLFSNAHKIGWAR